MTTSTFSTPKAKLRFIAISAIAALVAASAAHASSLLTIPVWAMFMGWVAYYTRGHSGRDGLVNYACLALGMVFGLVAAASIGALVPSLGALALPAVVLVVAILVVSLRASPVFNNVPAYFLGMIAVFAAHAKPTVEAFAELGLAGALGSFAAWFAATWQKRLVAQDL